MQRLLVIGFLAASFGLMGCQPTKIGTKPAEPVRQNVGGGGGGTVQPPIRPPVQPPIQPPYQPPIQQPPIVNVPPPVQNLPVPPPPGSQPPVVNVPPGVSNPPIYNPPIPPNQPPSVNIPPTVNPPMPPTTVYNPPTVNIPPTTPQVNPPETVIPPVRPPVVEYYEIPPINPQTEPPPCTQGVNCPPTQVNLPPVPPREDQTIVPPTVNPQTPVQTTPVQPTQPVGPVVQNPPVGGGVAVPRTGGGGVAMRPQSTGVGGGVPVVPQSGSATVVQPPVKTQPRVSLSSIPERKDINELEMFPTVKPAPKAPPASVTEVTYPTPKIVDKTCEPQKIDAEMEAEELDYLIGVDTSASMTGGLDPKSAEFKSGGELGRILRGIPSFVRQLDMRANVNIAIILGHGPASPQYHGKLFKAPGETSAVIKVQELKKGCTGTPEQIRDCALAKVTKALELKVRAISYARDMSDAQGEAIQLSLYNALMNSQNLELAKSQGFFRKKAVLMYMAAADENDVCFDYGDESKFKPAQVEIKDAKGKVTGKGRDPFEKKFFEEVCMKAANGHQFSYANLWDALLRLKDGDINKLVITPLIYLNNDMPMGVEDENEMGLGHYQLAVDLAHQPVADLAKVDRSNDSLAFNDQLTELGKFTSFRMKYNNIFQCATDVHPSSVNQSTLKVEVIDKKTGQPIATFSGACSKNGGECPADGFADTDIGMNGDGKHPFVRVSVPYETLSKKLADGKFEDGEVRIKFKTRSNVDQVTGVTVPSKETSYP